MNTHLAMTRETSGGTPDFTFYDEIPILVFIDGYKSFYVNGIYANTDILYIDIENLFNTLNIPCIISSDGDSISGFIDNNKYYSIDYYTGKTTVGDRILESRDMLVKEMGTLYMDISFFAEAFGITMIFNYRSLNIFLRSNFELPVIKQQRLEQQRKNLAKLKGEPIADTIIARKYNLFKFGMVDWAIASSQTLNLSVDNRLRLDIGTELLYGETEVSYNYNSRQEFDNRQFYYHWRWIDNDKQLIKQAELGKFSEKTISYINSPIIGGVIRNSPTTVRKASGYYTINEITEPNWIVELYINNVLLDWTKADASGVYTFKIPILYGYTCLKLKFYGPLGEERTEERTINIPFSFMPANEYEYSLSLGILEDGNATRFGKGVINYGVNRFITVGGGLEYLSSIPDRDLIPFLKTLIQPVNKLTLNLEYAHGVKFESLLNYNFYKNIFFEINYKKFVDGQQATMFSYLEERNVKLSIPFKLKKVTGFTKFNFTQFVYHPFNYNAANLMYSFYYRQFNANISSQFNWTTKKPAYNITSLAASYRMRNGFTFRPSTQFNSLEGKFITYKAEIEKRISKGYLFTSFEKNLMYKNFSFTLSFKYDLPFAKTSASFTSRRNYINFSESVQGSLGYEGNGKHIYKSNNSSVHKGGILIYPFIDINQNNIKEEDEPMVKLTSVKVFGGNVVFSEKDSVVRIPDLNAFVNYNVEFDDNDLGNIAWRFKHKIYQVLIDPNQFKRIDVPIISFGEVSGMVYTKNDLYMKGLGRILVKLYKKNESNAFAEVLTESDGSFYYLGLEPGDYVALIDPVQLNRLNMFSDYPQIEFKIDALIEGDIKEGINFILSKE